MVLGNVPQRLEGVKDGVDLGSALLRLAPETGDEAFGVVAKGEQSYGVLSSS